MSRASGIKSYQDTCRVFSDEVPMADEETLKYFRTGGRDRFFDVCRRYANLRHAFPEVLLTGLETHQEGNPIRKQIKPIGLL